MKNIIGISVVLLLAAFAGAAFAEEINCTSQYGECTMTETTYSCTCAGGEDSVSMVADGGGSEAQELSEENCLAMLEEMCRASTPIDSCESEYGECVIYEEWSSCECADGSNSGGGEGSEPGSGGEGDDGGSVDPDDETPPQSGKIVMPEESSACRELLAAECPNLPPDPATECSTEAFAVCNGMAQFALDCWGDKIWAYEIVDCCDEYEASSEEIGALWECFQASSCDTVGEDCYDGIEEADVGFIDNSKAGSEDGAEGEGELETSDGDAAEEDGDSAGDGSADTEKKDDSGCNQTSSTLPLALLLLALAFVKRAYNN